MMRFSALILLFLVLPITSQATDISVFAASSLTEALRLSAAHYEATHPGSRILLNFAGSQSLATQIEQGASADLLISANTATMQRLSAAHLIEKPRLLLHNTLAIAVRKETKPALKTITDLARPGVLLVIGNDQVPVGHYTTQFLANLAADPHYGKSLIRQISNNIVSHESMVKAVIAKLLLGEVDAGIVYRSDLKQAPRSSLYEIPIPNRYNPRADYPIAMTKERTPATKEFMSFLFSPVAGTIFTDHGFELA